MINVIKSYLVLSNLLVQISHMFFPWKSAQSVLCNIYHLIFLIKHNANIIDTSLYCQATGTGIWDGDWDRKRPPVPGDDSIISYSPS